jgi:hypothetical protein
MRLAKTVVNQRETFVRDLFRANPGMTGAEAILKVKETFGQAMRPNRVYALKTEVAAETLTVGPAPTSDTSLEANITVKTPTVDVQVAPEAPEVTTEPKTVIVAETMGVGVNPTQPIFTVDSVNRVF